MTLKYVFDEDFNNRVRHANKPTVVLFKADWCAPCKEFTPTVEMLAERIPQVDFVQIDIDDGNPVEGESSVIAQELSIRTVPSLVLFSDGMLVDVKVGRHQLADLRQWLNDNL
tara:strand:- start:181 stop:519 length:339 start_codon:yes stop_codon:yes gene_type:complete